MTRVRLRWWESLLLVLPVGVALLFLVGGEPLAGLVLSALIVVVVASRAEILERNIGGGHAKTRAVLLYVKATALLVIYVAAAGLMAYGHHVDHWDETTSGRVAVFALAGLGIYLFRDMWRLGDDADRWLRGGKLEAEIAHELDPLREYGWTVTHDLKRDDGGNVDHFAKGPAGAYAIEAKSGRLRAADRGQALSNAVWAKQKFGERWVTAVLCVSQEPPPAPEQVRHGNATLWIMGVRDLRPWLENQRPNSARRVERPRNT